MSNGFQAVDGDFAVATNTTSSFEDFLNAFGNEEAVADTNVEKVDAYEDSVEEGTEEFDLEENFKKFEELMDEEQEDETDEEDTEEVEEEIEDEEEYGYEIDDWNATITLPNGIEISAANLQDIQNLNEAKVELESRIEEMSHKERLLAENTNFGIQAIMSLEAQIMEVAKTRPLDTIEQIQYNNLQQIKAYMDTATGNFKNMYSKQIEQQAQMEEQRFNDNMDVVFRKYPNIQEDISDIKNYLSEKGMADPHGYLTSIKMDPMVIEILQDAITVSKVRNKLNKGAVKRVAKSVKGQAKASLAKQDMNQYDGISSHDIANYKGFMAAFGEG